MKTDKWLNNIEIRTAQYGIDTYSFVKLKDLPEAKAQILAEVMECLPKKDTRKHAASGVDQGIQIGFNEAINQFEEALKQKFGEK